jgi:hypothetical protein
MSDKILHKRSLTSGSIPSTESLEYGELAINVADGAIYLKKSGSTGDTIESVITTNTVTTGTVTIDGSILATTVDAIGITGSLQGTAQTASYVEWNNVDNKPTLVSQSVFNEYTQSTDLRLQSLETESGSIRSEFNSYTQSNDTLNTTQNNRLDGLSVESGSIRTTLNTYTSSTDLRVQSLEIESSSVRGRLENIESFSSSQLVLNPTFATTGSNIFIGNQTILGSTTLGDQSTDTLSITGSVLITGSDVTINNYTLPTQDGELPFSVLTTDGFGNTEFELLSTVYEQVKNVSGGILTKGTPVHAVGTFGFASEVVAADAGVPALMPATFILAQDLNDEEEGLGIVIGEIQGINTTGFTAGDPVYVAVGGGFTQTKPTGSALIQNLGIVTKVGTNGGGVVLGAGRANDIPNIQPGYFWVGNEDSVGTPTPTSSFTTTSSFNEYTSSANGRLTNLETESGSIRSTFNSYTSSNDLRLNTIETQTSSYARLDTDNTFTNLQTFTDINVNGTASFAYIQAVTGSSTSIGDAFIILNENTPASNFAGIKVIDSGSSFTTASFVYDGLNNNWVFQHQGIETSGSSLAIFGPLSQNGLGTEIGLTENRIPKALTDHGHHIGDSNISDDGVKVGIQIPLQVDGDISGFVITANNGFIGNLTGTAQTASYVQWNSVDNKPLLVSQSTFDTFQTNTNNRLGSLETNTGSINSSLANIRSFTESIDLRVDSLELFTSSIDTINTTVNNRLSSLEVESASIRTEFNSYTSSNDLLSITQNSRLDLLSTESGSTNIRLDNLQLFTSSINTTIKTQLDVNTVLSGSTQIRALTYYREDVSGNSSYTVTHNLNELYPIVQVYESGTNEQVIPLKIKSNSVNEILVEFTDTFAGSIIVKS